MSRRLLCVALSTCALVACQVPTDLNKPCTLVKKDPTDTTGKRSIPIKEGEIKPGKDFISFGAVECEDLVCVRDSLQPQGTDLNAEAKGYCSRSCLQTSTFGCPSFDSAMDSVPTSRLSCRALILDEATLASICQIDSATCTKYFGDTKSPYFCARGKTDGGS